MRRARISASTCAAAVAAASMVCALFAPQAWALKRTEFGDTVEADGKFSLIPARYETEVVPGQSIRIPGSLLNRTGRPITIVLEVSDIQAAADPDEFIERVEKSQFGAGSWVKPEIGKITLKHGEQVDFQIEVRPPLNAPVGSNYAGLLASVQSGAQGQGNAKLITKSTALAQLFFNVPGELQRQGEITKARVADTFQFHRGSSFFTYEVQYRNSGNVTDHVGGDLEITSMFGNRVSRMKIEPRVVLRASTRSFRVLWTDPPRFGRFSSAVTLQGDAGKRVRQMPSVIVLPPWWWFAVALSAVLLPVVYYVRSRRAEWRMYLEEGWEEDEDWEELMQ